MNQPAPPSSVPVQPQPIMNPASGVYLLILSNLVFISAAVHEMHCVIFSSEWQLFQFFLCTTFIVYFFSTCIFCVFTYVKQNNKKKKKKKIIPNKSGTVWFLPVTTWCTSGLSIQMEFALGEGRLRQNVTRPVWHVWELWLNSYFCTCTHCVMSFKAMWEYSRESVHWNHSKRASRPSSRMLYLAATPHLNKQRFQY